jgi:pantoate--beta-alanine ligase
MEIVRAPRDLRARTGSLRESGSTVGLVPTMGALHAGHGSLIRRARDENDAVVVSIFVNPLQFGPDEDLDRYPRDEAADIAFCQREGVDVIWEPAVDQMYPPGRDLPVPDPGPVGATFEGAARPGHFAGVLTVVRRLFDVNRPARAYFGEKDAQQLFLVRRMVAAEPALGVEVVACPTIRELDGLALSSRNRFLQGEEREQATCLFLALTEAAERARSGERDAGVLVAVMAREIGATPLARLDYAAVVDEATFEGAATVGASSRAIVAARFPSARLIDNLLLPTPSATTSG